MSKTFRTIGAVLLPSLLLWGALLTSCTPEGPETPVVEKATVSVSPTSYTFNSQGTDPLTISVTASGKWTSSKSVSWITVSPDQGTGNAKVTVTAGNNTSTSARTATLTFSTADGDNKVVNLTQEGYVEPSEEPIVANPAAFDGKKRSSTTYQLLIYSFADSNGDGIGDFKGIQNRLDYLDAMGVTALWLSPAHPSDSYHAYDVTDYYSVNPLYGTEQDFKNLIDAAHDKGIKIYMDYVLNHSGKGNAWFQEALSDPTSKYRSYYFFSTSPSQQYSTFPMLKGTSYQAGEWKQATSGSPKLTITQTTDPVTNGTSNWNIWAWKAGQDGEPYQFVEVGDGTYYLVADLTGTWGLLVRKYMNWNDGSKFGAAGSSSITLGTPIDLVSNGSDISFTGSGRYRIELTNVTTENIYYMGCFSDWMPDLNYGDVSTAENNDCFKGIAGSADKWINLGVDGFRLDAVKHICGGIDSYNHTANQTLLKKWYDHCNATYKSAGHTDNIFMVAEEWDGHGTEKNYYKSLTSCFEFDYFGALTTALAGNATNYVSSVSGYVNDHLALRSDAITSLFMTNHDQDRAAEAMGRNLAKEKQAAAALLTSPGKPFIYQGEELGYYGTKAGGDEYVRTPIMWKKDGSGTARKGVNDKVDNAMLTSAISVEAQDADANSLLNTYKTFTKLRNTYPALAEGKMSAVSGIGATSVAAWYMTSGSEKMLVVHNFSSSAAQTVTLTVNDDMSNPVAVLGKVSKKGKSLFMGANSSVVFKL